MTSLHATLASKQKNQHPPSSCMSIFFSTLLPQLSQHSWNFYDPIMKIHKDTKNELDRYYCCNDNRFLLKVNPNHYQFME